MELVSQESSLSVPSLEAASAPFQGRRVTSIDARIPPEEFLVYHFLTRDHIRCDRNGKFLDGHNDAGFLFHCFEDAEAFAKAEADVSPRIGTGIYNSAWKIVAEFVNEEFTRKQVKANTPQRLFLWATALTIVGSGFLWLEIRSGWTVMFGFIIGSRLLLSGFLKLAKGIYRLKQGTIKSA
jgi:hypothetical protein